MPPFLHLLPVLILACAVADGADAASLVFAVDGKVLASTVLPSGWTVAAAADGKQTIVPVQRRPHIQVWPLAAADIAAAEKDIAAMISSEVKSFEPATRSDRIVAGRPARQLIGPGVEADDGDPGNAEVTLFSIAGRVFVLVSHGEGNGPAERHAELAAVLSSIPAAP